VARSGAIAAYHIPSLCIRAVLQQQLERRRLAAAARLVHRCFANLRSGHRRPTQCLSAGGRAAPRRNPAAAAARLGACVDVGAVQQEQAYDVDMAGVCGVVQGRVALLRAQRMRAQASTHASDALREAALRDALCAARGASAQRGS
jgi:hypothetical protein